MFNKYLNQSYSDSKCSCIVSNDSLRHLSALTIVPKAKTKTTATHSVLLFFVSILALTSYLMKHWLASVESSIDECLLSENMFIIQHSITGIKRHRFNYNRLWIKVNSFQLSKSIPQSMRAGWKISSFWSEFSDWKHERDTGRRQKARNVLCGLCGLRITKQQRKKKLCIAFPSSHCTSQFTSKSHKYRLCVVQVCKLTFVMLLFLRAKCHVVLKKMRHMKCISCRYLFCWQKKRRKCFPAMELLDASAILHQMGRWSLSLKIMPSALTGIPQWVRSKIAERTERWMK